MIHIRSPRNVLSTPPRPNSIAKSFRIWLDIRRSASFAEIEECKSAHLGSLDQSQVTHSGQEFETVSEKGIDAGIAPCMRRATLGVSREGLQNVAEQIIPKDIQCFGLAFHRRSFQTWRKVSLTACFRE